MKPDINSWKFVNWQNSRCSICPVLPINKREIKTLHRAATWTGDEEEGHRRRVYYAKRDRTRERSDNDIFQNNSLFQGSSFAYEWVEATGRAESGISVARSFSGCSLPPPLCPSSLPTLYSWRLVAAGRLIEYTWGQCSLHNTGVSRKWRYGEGDRTRVAKPRELAALKQLGNPSFAHIYCVTHNWPCCKLTKLFLYFESFIRSVSSVQ